MRLSAALVAGMILGGSLAWAHQPIIIPGTGLGSTIPFYNSQGISTVSNNLKFDGTTLTTTGPLTLTTAASKIIPGATSLSLRNNADSADNLLIANAGDLTVRNGLAVGTPTGGLPGTSKINAVDYQRNGTTIIPTLTQKRGSGGGNYTTTSATYVDVDATNLKLTVTIPTGSKLTVFADVVASNGTTATLGLAIFDGAVVDETLMDFAKPVNTRSQMFVQTVINGDGNSHTVKLQWKVSAGTGILENASATLAPRMAFIMAPSDP